MVVRIAKAGVWVVWVTFLVVLAAHDSLTAFAIGLIFGAAVGVYIALPLVVWGRLRSDVKDQEGLSSEQLNHALPFNWRILLFRPEPYFNWIERKDRS